MRQAAPDVFVGVSGVAVGRKPELFVRPVSIEEGQRLQRISRTSKDPVRLRRAIVVWASAQGQPVPDIAHVMRVSEDYVRDVIHAFNAQGFGALDPKWSGGAPKKISERVRGRICALARCDPRILRQPFSTWSLSKLRDYLVAEGVVAAISRADPGTEAVAGIPVLPEGAASPVATQAPVRDRGRLRAAPAHRGGLLVRRQQRRVGVHSDERLVVELDRVEFAALRYFALNGTDNRSHAEQNAAIGAHIRWHNRHAHPKRDIAIGSKIRQPDYKINFS